MAARRLVAEPIRLVILDCAVPQQLKPSDSSFPKQCSNVQAECPLTLSGQFAPRFVVRDFRTGVLHHSIAPQSSTTVLFEARPFLLQGRSIWQSPLLPSAPDLATGALYLLLLVCFFGKEVCWCLLLRDVLLESFLHTILVVTSGAHWQGQECAPVVLYNLLRVFLIDFYY